MGTRASVQAHKSTDPGEKPQARACGPCCGGSVGPPRGEDHPQHRASTPQASCAPRACRAPNLRQERQAPLPTPGVMRPGHNTEREELLLHPLTDGETEARGKSLIRNMSQPRCTQACTCPRHPPSPAHASVNASITLCESPQAPLPTDRVGSPADWPHSHSSKQNKASRKT